MLGDSGIDLHPGGVRLFRGYKYCSVVHVVLLACRGSSAMLQGRMLNIFPWLTPRSSRSLVCMPISFSALFASSCPPSLSCTANQTWVATSQRSIWRTGVSRGLPGTIRNTRLTGDLATPTRKTSRERSISGRQRATTPAMAKHSSPSQQRTQTTRCNGATPRRR